jgi:hypothetical protein
MKKTLKEIKRKAPEPPPKEPTFRERLVDLFLVAEKRRREDEAFEQNAILERASERVMAFLQLDRVPRQEAKLFKIEAQEGDFLYVEFRGVSIFPDPSHTGLFRVVFKCPWCKDPVRSNLTFGSNQALGELLFREDKNTLEPMKEHQVVCEKIPDDQRPEAIEAKQDEEIRLIDMLRELLK